jgi:hypothetical protein
MGSDMFRPVGDSKVSDFTNLTCIQQILCDCYVLGRDSNNRCVPGTDYWAYNTLNGSGYSKDGNPLAAGLEFLVDECIAIKLGDLKSPGYCGTFSSKHLNTLRDRQRCRTSKGNTYGCNEDPLSSACTSNQASSFVVLDSQCRPVPNAQSGSVCGQFDAWTQWSPISLVWNSNAPKTKSLVTFPLNPNSEDTVYEWQGSAEMPLLVYDPEHSGMIRSGAQLFGNWTWGGKRQANLAINPRLTSAWKNGFEPLAELDIDQNGKVDGEELLPLGLWFDKNQDGKSQPGEVRSADQAGVTALFYTPDREQATPREIVASVGFERIEDGKVVRGALVDWFAHETQSKVEVALQQQLLNLNEPLTNDHLEALLRERTQAATSVSRVVGKERFAGAWKWSVHEDSPNRERGNLSGTLVIVTDEDSNNVRGQSIIEVPLEGGDADQPRALLSNSQITGIFQADKDGTSLLVSVLDGPRVVAVSTIKASADGKTLRGTTTTGSSAEHGSLRYEWEATRH